KVVSGSSFLSLLQATKATMAKIKIRRFIYWKWLPVKYTIISSTGLLHWRWQTCRLCYIRTVCVHRIISGNSKADLIVNNLKSFQSYIYCRLFWYYIWHEKQCD